MLSSCKFRGLQFFGLWILGALVFAGWPEGSAAAAAPPPGQSLPGAVPPIPVDNFESVSAWTGLVLERTLVHRGNGAGRWENHLRQKDIQKRFSPPVDAASQSHFQFWLYSQTANQALIELILDSDNPDDTAGWDYYRYQILVNWQGWRYFRIPLGGFSVARNPRGWNRLNYVRLASDGWSHTPKADTLLIVDDMSFQPGILAGKTSRRGFADSDYLYNYDLELRDRTGVDRRLDLAFAAESGFPFRLDFSRPAVELPAFGTLRTTASIRIPAAAIQPQTLLDTYGVEVTVLENGESIDAERLDAAVPLPSRPPPRLLLDTGDVARIKDWARSEPWAQKALNDIVASADNWPSSFQKKYALAAWTLPPEGGQWVAWYICPNGVRLRFDGPGKNICPVDSKNYTGWPYDQVVYSWMHQELAQSALDLGLAYQLTGKIGYAQSSAAILRAYADRYRAYAYHDTQGRPGNSGGRVLSQTLDEANWLIPVAWAFDLVAASGVMTSEELLHVEQDLLREAVATIKRNPTGVSNWQSWHNTAIGAAGFALDDPLLQAYAIRNPANGFLFQMRESVAVEGIWYEGSWGYHFYALSALQQLAEMTARAGLDLYASAALRGMFTVPLAFAMPDLTLPAFNDSGTLDLSSRGALYESAYARYGDARFATLIARRSRGREALLWGHRSISSTGTPDQGSSLFPDAGYAILRAGQGLLNSLVAVLDFGPHGGWHGHYDKLGFVLFGRGKMLGVDPGTQSYAAPSHNSWDKVTVAHNTVVVDGQSQAEATGNLHRFLALPALSLAAADAGSAYRSARLLRTLLVTEEYVIDRYSVQANDGAEHQMDWIYHNFGAVATTLPLSPYSGLPTGNGYEHLSKVGAATADEDWSCQFSSSGWPALQLRMVAQPGTTVVTGLGLGPNILEPVPFAMARRTARHTVFNALLEPFSTASQIRAFRLLPTNALDAEQAGAFSVEATDFQDQLLMVAEGSAGRLRSFGEGNCDGFLCLVRRDRALYPRRLALAGGTRLEAAGQLLIQVETPTAGLQVDYSDAGARVSLQTDSITRSGMLLFAPDARQLAVNGTDRKFQRRGEFIWIPSLDTSRRR